MKITFLIYNYIEEKLPLQPWLTVREIVVRLVADGHVVSIVTDVDDFYQHDSVETIAVRSLRGSNSEEVETVIENLEPEAVVSLVTPLNLVSTGWLRRLNCKTRIAFASYPFYSLRQLLVAAMRISFGESKQYLRHALVPRRWWRRRLLHDFDHVVTQSYSSQHRLQRICGPEANVHAIVPGIDKAGWPYYEKQESHNTINFLYLGNASDIRGFDVCLDAFAKAPKNSTLTILARSADDAELMSIKEQLQHRDITARTTLTGGWMNRDDMLEQIHHADAVVLPFVLVPSELPVSVMEVIACGTPVITTDIDGLPSTVGDAGLIVRQGSVRSLVEAMQKFCDGTTSRKSLQQHCNKQCEAMSGWDVMYERWQKCFQGEA